MMMMAWFFRACLSISRACAIERQEPARGRNRAAGDDGEISEREMGKLDEWVTWTLDFIPIKRQLQAPN